MSEQENWQVSSHAAEMYEERFVPAIFQQWAPRVADAAKLVPGDRVLDVACGTGVVARECAVRVGPTGQVIGLDINAGMLTVAQRLRPEIEWRHGDAADLPFADGAFDAVVCQFALMFFPDRVTPLREMWRVLAPGGRLAVAVWGPIEEIPAYVALASLAARHAGPMAADIVNSPFVLGDKADVAEIFRIAGIENIEIGTQEGTERFASIDDFVETEVKGSPLVDVVDETAYAALAKEAYTDLGFCSGNDGRVEFASPAHIITARKA